MADANFQDVIDVANMSNEQKLALYNSLGNDIKRAAKRKAKSEQRIKWIIGNRYYLLTKVPFGNKRIYREFELKKFCYARNEMPINILIMKEVTQNNIIKYTLNPNDCRKYHIKYEIGLQIFPMGMNWNEK